jgi:hypothetical protein
MAAGVALRQVEGAVFERADLRRAPLRGAKLDGGKLNGADLTYAELNDADLRDAELAFADLSFAVLVNTHFNERTVLDLARIGPVTPGLRPDGFPSSWSNPPSNYEAAVQDGQIHLRRKGGPPARLPFPILE